MVTTHHLILLTGSCVSFVPSKTLKNIFYLLNVYACAYVHMCACVCASCMYMRHEHTSEHTWRSEECVRELVLSFYHVGSGAEVQPSGLGQALSLAGSLYPLPSQTVLHI